MNAENLKPSTYYLVRYVPHPEREEFLNLGLLLHTPDDQFLDCLITSDLRRVKRFHAPADLEFLRELQDYFDQQIQQNEDDLAGVLEFMGQSFSNLIELAPPRALLVAEPAAQLRELFERLVGQPPAEIPADNTRMRIKQALVQALRRVRLFDDPRFEKRIPAAQLTHPGNPFHFDFGYRPASFEGKPNGHLKLIHALSLHRDHKLASELVTHLGYVRSKQPAELTAVVEGWPSSGDKTAGHSRRVLEDAGIILRPVDQADAFAEAVRAELA